MTSPPWVKRRPFLMPIGLLLGAAAAGACALALACWWLITAPSLQVIVVPVVGDPASTEGVAADAPSGAERLARLWADARSSGHIDALYVGGSPADHDWAAPSATRLGLRPVSVSEKGADLARRVLDEHPGGRVLIVVSKERVPALMARLTGETSSQSLASDELWVVAIPRIGRATYLRLRY
jgi:hypothetical protein